MEKDTMMKKYFCLFVILLTAMFSLAMGSCGDDDVESSADNMFVGTWELEHTGSSYAVFEYANSGKVRVTEYPKNNPLMGTYEVQKGQKGFDYRIEVNWYNGHKESYDVRTPSSSRYVIYQDGEAADTFNKISNKVGF